MDNNQAAKRIEQAEYRAKMLRSELDAIKSSKAFRASRKAGVIKGELAKNPLGLVKKVVKKIITQPGAASKMLRGAANSADVMLAVAEQTAAYQEWIILNEPDEDELRAQRKDADALKYRPLISIITPVFNPPKDVFIDLIESVLNQTYSNFELLLGNFGDNQDIHEVIVEYAKADERIKHLAFSENLGIAGNSNQILAKAQGEYIALLDHDDTISPDALYENAKLLNQKPYDFVYSDKDKIDEKGNRFDPLFKPHYSPEMMLNVNYLTHLNVMRTAIVKKIGGWDPKTDGAQDWDLFLRVVAESKHIGFIPKVLYHWRVIATSTALSIETKPYALANQCKAVDKYLIHNNIPARAYTRRTELLLDWDQQALDKQPLVYIDFSNQADSLRLQREVTKSAPQAVIVNIAQESNVEPGVAHVGKQKIYTYKDDQLEAIAQTIQEKGTGSKIVLLMSDKIHVNSDDWYKSLIGWVAIKEVAAASGRLVNKYDRIVESGGIISANNEYIPLFKDRPKYFQGYIGNAEWVRNLSIIAPLFAAVSPDDLNAYFKDKKTAKRITFDDFCIWATKTKKKRLVLSPHATALLTHSDAYAVKRPLKTSATPERGGDIFGSSNTHPEDPMKLFEHEDVNITEVNPEKDAYQHDAIILSNTYDLSQAEIDAVRAAQKQPIHKVESVAWVLPSFDAVYAGLMNIFNFVDFLNKKGLQTTIYILTAELSAKNEQALALKALPELKSVKFVAMRPDQIDKIDNHDLGIATQWATVYPLAKAKNIGRRYYFIQDHEINFYPKGSISALVELTYKLGLIAIAGTEGLLNLYRTVYGGKGIVLGSKVDLSAYHPREDKYYTPKAPYKVFFYARPNMPRNAFELGIAGLKKLKNTLGDKVEIITAGADWDALQFGVQGMFTNLGKIEYGAVPKLYRSVDAGLMFMFSGHPGVTASELMASGCPVVVNEYDDTTWHELYQHEVTCLVTVPTASEIARNLERCLSDTDLRKKLIDGGLKKAHSFYGDYKDSQEAAYQHIKSDATASGQQK